MITSTLERDSMRLRIKGIPQLMPLECTNLVLLESALTISDVSIGPKSLTSNQSLSWFSKSGNTGILKIPSWAQYQAFALLCIRVSWHFPSACLHWYFFTDAFLLPIQINRKIERQGAFSDASWRLEYYCWKFCLFPHCSTIVWWGILEGPLANNKQDAARGKRSHAQTATTGVYAWYIGYTRHIPARSFVLFGWCTCGICHIPTIHQPMSHLQKFPICVNIGSFVVIYARCTPGFGTFVGIRSFCTKMYAPHMPGFWQSI